MRRALFPFAFVTFLVGCGSPGGSAPAAGGGQTLRLALSISPETIDPTQSRQVETNDLLAHVFETLVGFDEQNQIVGLLAEKWTISPDGKTIDFDLRSGVKFHDGRELTAEDVKASWERVADPASPSPLADDYLGDVEGLDERTKGKADEIKGVQVTGPLKLKVTLVASRPSFLSKLTYMTTAVLPKGLVSGSQTLSDPAMAIGTGPFKLAAYIPQQEVTLVANENYREGKPKIDRIAFRIAKDTATRVSLFRAGQIDLLALPAQDVEAFRKDPKTKDRVQLYDSPSINYIGMNGSVYAPFKDARVRRAFVMAVDRSRIVDSLLVGVGKTADGILPPVIPQDSAATPPPFDVASAKQLLKEAGFEKLPPIELWMSDSSQDRKRIAEYVVGQLTENLGIDAKIRLAESSVIVQRASEKKLGFFYGNWSADYLDAENFLSVMLSDYGQDRSNWKNAAFSALTRKADSEPDPVKRRALYAKAETLALTECPWIPLYFPQDAIVVREGITGLRRNAFGFMPHSQVEIARH